MNLKEIDFSKLSKEASYYELRNRAIFIIEYIASELKELDYEDESRTQVHDYMCDLMEDASKYLGIYASEEKYLSAKPLWFPDVDIDSKITVSDHEVLKMEIYREKEMYQNSLLYTEAITQHWHSMLQKMLFRKKDEDATD